MQELDTLRRALAVAMNEKNDALRKVREAEDAYAMAKAASIGLHVGTSIVTTACKQGFGSKAKVVTRRYRVVKFSFVGYKQNELSIWGVTIRKDGSEGEKHEIWQDWVIEKESEILA